MDLSKLKEPFPPEDIEWRIQQGGVKENKPWALVLAYISNRAIMDRLDSVCGPEKWSNNYAKGPDGGILCSISIKIGDEWVTKWDGAENTQVEAIKGGLSSAMKRAGAQWGIGRYLYKLDVGFAKFIDGKGKYKTRVNKNSAFYNWNPPILPLWALPEGSKKTEPAVIVEKTKDTNARTQTDGKIKCPARDKEVARIYCNKTCKEREGCPAWEEQ